MNCAVLYTIGHSTHSLDAFIELLRRHGVNAVADVRSRPFSRIQHFNGDPLAAVLRERGIQYVFLGRELGARREEPACYVDGQAVYERVALLPAFGEGLQRVRQGMRRHTIALMCAEKEPAECHRTILVCRHLGGDGIEIRHILADGSIETHEALLQRLVREQGVERTLFEPELSDADLAARALDHRGQEIAYRAKPDSDSASESETESESESESESEEFAL